MFNRKLVLFALRLEHHVQHLRDLFDQCDLEFGFDGVWHIFQVRGVTFWNDDFANAGLVRAEQFLFDAADDQDFAAQGNLAFRADLGLRFVAGVFEPLDEVERVEVIAARQSPRLLAKHDADKAALVEAALQLTRELGFSSFHSLFPTAPDQAVLSQPGMQLLHRTGFQYHWNNNGYPTFDDFLAAMTHDKRKKIRQERRKLEAAGIRFRWVTGTDSTPADWDFFERCYTDTYARHRSEPHLNRAFFDQLRATQPESMLLIIAERDSVPVACSFNLMDDKRLYGRHWGAVEYVPGLHFETCYYQGIEYAIHHGLQVFEGGAQGEHKLARGLVPIPTHSYHWLENAEFRTAVDRFLEREEAAITHYIDELEGPFRQTAGSSV